MLLLVILLSYWKLTRAASGECQFSLNEYNFDLTDLRTSEDYLAESKEYQYAINFCGNVASHSDCSGSVCQYSKSTHKEVSVAAHWTTAPAPVWSWLDSTKPAAGLTLRYENGDYCGGTGKKTRIVTIHMPCAPTTDGRKIEVESDTTDSCSGNGYTFKFPTCHTCIEGCNGLALSQGSVLIILGCVVFLVYLSLGCWYNHRTYNTAYGLESLPHLEHWKTLPGLVYDGMRYSYRHGMKLYTQFQNRPSASVAPGSAGAKKEKGNNIEKQGLLSDNNE